MRCYGCFGGAACPAAELTIREGVWQGSTPSGYRAGRVTGRASPCGTFRS